MNILFSKYLDAVRFMAAIVVFISHFSYPRFTDGNYLIVQQLNLGRDAVNIFFVLSGFIIAYTVHAKDRNLGIYIFNRLTRLYSVVLPAIILTLALDFLGRIFCIDCYTAPWYFEETPVWQKTIQALTFSNEFFMSPVRIGSNGPFWSLCYEFIYYALFGAMFFLKRKEKFMAILILCLLSGPAILILFPIWWSGAQLYKWTTKTTQAFSRDLSWLLTLTPFFFYVWALYFDIPKYLEVFTVDILGPYFTFDVLRYSFRFIWNSIVGLLFIFHLMGVFSLTKNKTDSANSKILDGFVWGAKRSLTIYLLHTPILQFLDALFPESLPFRHLILFAGTLMFCLLIAKYTELRLGHFRAFCQTLILRKSGRDIPHKTL